MATRKSFYSQSEVTNPPGTAVSLVDLRRQKTIVTGDISKDVERERAPRKPDDEEICICLHFEIDTHSFVLCLELLSCNNILVSGAF